MQPSVLNQGWCLRYYLKCWRMRKGTLLLLFRETCRPAHSASWPG